eukprot:1154243-Pelagomonas_calceolata.AAC.4
MLGRGVVRGHNQFPPHPASIDPPFYTTFMLMSMLAAECPGSDHVQAYNGDREWKHLVTKCSWQLPGSKEI